MTEIVQAPLVRCDNCGTTEKQNASGTGKERKWRKPREWGHVRVSPVHWGAYPDNIDLLDLCPRCVKIVHAAVSEALNRAKKDSLK